MTDGSLTPGGSGGTRPPGRLMIWMWSQVSTPSTRAYLIRTQSPAFTSVSRYVSYSDTRYGRRPVGRGSFGTPPVASTSDTANFLGGSAGSTTVTHRLTPSGSSRWV